MASTEVLTRVALKSDLPFVLEMIHGLAEHHGDGSTVTLEQLEVEAHDWHHLLVATIDEKVVAYASLMPVGQLQFGVRGMDMHHLFVLKEHRGVGVGRALINASLELSKQLSCKYMTVGTHPDNTATAEVYLAAGFERLPNAPRFQICIDG